jgi:photosystem II stability/assembly factor-like uncharacterized protein
MGDCVKTQILICSVKFHFLLLLGMLFLPHIASSQWIQQTSGTTATLTDVVMLDSVTAIATGINGSILRTTDAGNTWNDVAAPLSYIQPWNAVSFLNSFEGIIVGNGGAVTTTNGGENWMWRSIPAVQNFTSALYFSSGSIYVGSDSGYIFHSVDSGKSWLQEKISDAPIVSIFTQDGIYLWGYPLYALTPFSLFKTYIYPSTKWNETVLNFLGLGSGANNGVFCPYGGPGFIVGVHGDLRAATAILRKRTADTVWYTSASASVFDGTLFGVSAPTATTAYACGMGGTILKTIDGGDTWNRDSVSTYASLHSIVFFDSVTGFVVGELGTIYFTSNGGVTSIKEVPADIPEGFGLEQNYPNPFNPSTAIDFKIPVSGFTSLKIYDVLGKEVAAIVSEVLSAGNHHRQWNALAVAGGIYYYRLQFEKYSEIKKLAVIR